MTLKDAYAGAQGACGSACALGKGIEIGGGDGSAEQHEVAEQLTGSEIEAF